jgi:beta-lactamase regulating signal transducer with metallopeptidase domain
MVSTILFDAWATTMWQACWQGSIVILVVWTICRLLPSMPARYQCWFWRLAILKVVMVLLCPTLLNLPLLPTRSVVVHEVSSQGAVDITVATDVPVVADKPANPMDHVQISQSKAMELPSFRTILCFAWLIGVGWCLARLLAAWNRARQLRKQSHIIDCVPLNEQLAIQGRLFGLRNLPKLVEVVGGGSPMLIGLCRPAIVIPTETLGRLSISEQTMVLGHELAHIQRADLIWGLIASIVRAVFFFHPLVWWSEWQLKLAQEVAADELVIAQQHYDPARYGRLLVSVVSKLGHRPMVSTISMETAGTVHSLARRLVAMTCIGRTSYPVIASSGILLGAVVLLGLVPWRLVAAEPKEGDKQPLPSTVGEKQTPSSKENQPKDGQVLPLEKLLTFTSMATTTLQYKRAEKECVGKTFHGVIDISDVDETEGKVVIIGGIGALVCIGDEKNGYTAKQQPEFRFMVEAPQLKDKAAEFSRLDKVQVTAKLQRLWKEGPNAADTIAEFADVTSLKLEPIPKNEVTQDHQLEGPLVAEKSAEGKVGPLSKVRLDAEPKDGTEQAKAIAEIEKLGGKVIVDEKSPDKPVPLIDLRETKVTDAGLEHLKGFSQLQYLFLGHTDVTDAGLEHLKGLSQLQMLDLSGTKVTDAGLEHLKGLTQLQTLFLGNHITDAGLENLKGLPQLHTLSLCDTQITDVGLEHLKGLSQLQTLHLGNTQLTDDGLEHLKGLKQLRWLDLGNTQLTDDDLEHLKGLKLLVRLNLYGTKVTDAGVEHLQGLTQLQTLGLCDTQITDAGLEHLKGLTQLQRLYLGNTQVMDAGLEHLKGLSKLQYLDLGETKVTDAGVKKLQQALPNCEIER